jgi:chromosome segregation ATPase
LISRLKKKKSGSAQLPEKVESKDENIESYKLKISELNHQLETAREQTERQVTEMLNKQFQANLNKSNKQIERLKEKLVNCEKRGKKKSQKKEGAEMTSLQDQLELLKELLNRKEKKIEELQMSKEKEISPRDKSEVKLGSANVISTLNEELQMKLNKAKMEIRTLKEQLNGYKKMENRSQGKSRMEFKASEQLVNQLQQKLAEQDRLLEIKDDQYITIKNEAVQINSRLDDLKNQIRLKDQTIDKFKSQLESVKAENSLPELDMEDSQLSLRIREMRSLIDDLKKQIKEQRLEISQLREK